jgi:hypothetical protein
MIVTITTLGFEFDILQRELHLASLLDLAIKLINYGYEYVEMQERGFSFQSLAIDLRKHLRIARASAGVNAL